MRAIRAGLIALLATSWLAAAPVAADDAKLQQKKLDSKLDVLVGKRLVAAPLSIEGGLAGAESAGSELEAALTEATTCARDANALSKGKSALSFSVVAGRTVGVAVHGASKALRRCVMSAVKAARFENVGASSTIEATLQLRLPNQLLNRLVGGMDEPSALGGMFGTMEGGWGYGLSGTGTGRGVAGVGTIGTGRYGTLGHGTGKPGIARVSRVQVGQVARKGPLDKNIIRRVIRRSLAQFRYCYEKELVRAPTLGGTIVTKFTIGPDGKTSSVTATGMGNAKVERCLRRVVARLRFPKPRGGGIVQVRYPFVFRPASARSSTGLQKGGSPSKVGHKRASPKKGAASSITAP